MPVAGSTTGRYSPSEVDLLPMARSFLLFVCGEKTVRYFTQSTERLSCNGWTYSKSVLVGTMPVAGSTTGRYSPSELALLPIAHSFLCVTCLFAVGDIMSRIDVL